jgi:hypothetical protein
MSHAIPAHCGSYVGFNSGPARLTVCALSLIYKGSVHSRETLPYDAVA